MTPKSAALTAVSVLLFGLVAAACGSTDHQAHARSLYNAYRTAEDSRTDAEEKLRLAFRDISEAAQAQDREGVQNAAHRGQDAVDEVDALISAELEAAEGLADLEGLSTHAQQLSEGLRLSRSSLELIAKELEIALDDPFLETRKKEVDDLAKESAKLAAKGELAVRRADRALAIALGLEPRPDQMFIPTTTG